MESSFDKRAVQCYSNFMKYTISNAIFNLILIILENSTILFIIDLMFHDNILGEALTPLYFLSPHLYVDLLNQQFENECNKVFYIPTSENGTAVDEDGEPITIYDEMYKNFNDNDPTYDIVFFGRKLYSTENAYCIYSSKLILIVVGMIGLLAVAFIVTFFIDTRSRPNIVLKILVGFLTNLVNIFVRPLFIVIVVVLTNRIIVYMYKPGYIKEEYKTEELIYMLVSLFLLFFAVMIAYIHLKFINNIFYFENLPFDYFSKDEAFIVLVIKVIIGFKISFDKLLGINNMSVMNLIIGLLLAVRSVYTLSSRESVVNHVYLKNFSAFLSFFYCFYIILKLLNEYVSHLKEYSTINLTMELILIFIVLVSLVLLLFNVNSKFTFKTKENFIVESMQFMYYVSRNLSFSNLKNKKEKREVFIDNVIIGHKMKCKMEDCIICCEDIYNPDLKTLCMILYQQFLENEKDFKEENEGLTLLIKLMYLKLIDEKKIHRISFTILKNLKNKNLSFGTLLKISYMYSKNLDELNTDLRGLLTIKYGEINTELLKCIKNFEDILGFIKSKTEKVELVTNKTNLIGKMYEELIKDLHYLKRNKRIYFDPANLLQIICIVRLIFPRLLDAELTESLDYNFIDFLEIVDHVFSDNISFLVRYDFNNKTWRIKKIPKKFIDMTGYKISELLDQSLEKIFPKTLAKSRIKQLENEIILSNITDSKLEFKTVICDAETNARYVRFVIDIIPHLENSYMLYMHCHFHKRQLLIIDEFGNFVNGCQILYEKVGINADIVAASKGRINMFTMFNLDKKQKFEDVKIVSIASEGVVDATKNLFLLENEEGKPKQTTMPNFLDSFIKNEAAGGIKKDKSVVFLHLFSKETINEIKYYIYNIKISNPEDKKKQKTEGKEEGDNSGGNRHTVTIKRLNTDYSNSSEDRELLPRDSTLKGKDKNKEDKKEDDINTYQNYVNYYNTFYESQHSMSMTMNYKANLDSYTSSQAGSTNSDVFNYLYMKAIGNKSHSNKFETFIYGIFIFNIILVLYGLSSIIYIKTYSNDSINLLRMLSSFYIMTGRIYKATNNFFLFFKYNKDSGTDLYYEYLKNTLGIENAINYEKVIKIYLDYDSSNNLQDINNFITMAFDYLGSDKYEEKLDYNTSFIHLEPSGSFAIKGDQVKSVLDLLPITTNQLANKIETTIFLNISYLEYTYHDLTATTYPELMELTSIDPEKLTKEEKQYFTELINIYQHFFNYFNAFVNNFQNINDYLMSIAVSHFDSLHSNGKILLIVILIINIIFVLICLFSIIIYRKILKKEFRALYGLSEDSISKLKEKFQYVKELIKWEQSPSKIYEKIRKMREEIDQAQLEEKMKQKRKERSAQIAENQKKMGDKGRTNSIADDTMSVLTTGSTGRTNDYLRFSGAVKGLFRSSTLRAKEQLQKLSKETRKQKASQDLLKRLNFDFEMIQNFIFFIAFMTFFYLAVGITVIIISDSNFKNVEVSLEFTEKFHNKFFDLFLFYSGTKLSIIFNKNSPYTLQNGEKGPFCEDCMFSFLYGYSSLTGEISKISTNNKNFDLVYQMSEALQGETLCESFYTSYKSDLNTFVENAAPGFGIEGISEGLKVICQGIPILSSNIDSIFTYLIVTTRTIYSEFITGEKDITTRTKMLQNSFYETDIVLSLFVNFYYEYTIQESISNLNKNVTNTFYSFMIVIFVINIFIDFFMMLFIWFKIYIQIISSVNNVQLVTDSVSII